MENLAAICLLAFAVVFVLLSLLAAIMGAITTLFPEKDARTGSAGRTDAAVLAAVTAAVAALLPGARLVNLEEDR